MSSSTETAAAPSGVAALDPPEDVDGRDLGLERQVARDQHDGAELADRPRERERDAGEDRRQQVREDDAPEDRERARAERRGRLLHLAVELEQHGLHGADDERQRHEEQRDEHGRSARERDVQADAARSARRARAASGPATIVGSAKGRSMSALTTDCPRKAVADEHPGDDRAHDGVDERDGAETPSVSFSAATACGSVIASQKPPRPPFAASQVSAASGQQDDEAR